MDGRLLIVGGAEDKDDERTILRRFIRLAGGPEARIAVITAATEYQEAVGQEYRSLFQELGAGEVRILHVRDREHASNVDSLEMLRDRTGIFFTGGDQLRITSMVGGTALDTYLRDAWTRGAVIAGTSAGASAMSDSMIVEGSGKEEPRKCTVKLAPGLGLVRHAVIDQHFAQRGRIGRLLGAVAQNPYILGIGIDEDTAIEVWPTGKFRVIGSGSVTVIDGRSISISNVSEARPNEPLALANVRLHVLPAGYCYDLRERCPAALVREEE
jgi:cyanophycinase